ncbi:MAG: MFS transporter [Bacteroidota bacterium]
MTTDDSNPHVIIAALWLLVFAASSQVMIISPILPLIGMELGVSPAVLGTLVTAYSIALAVSAVTIGPISDKVGRRRVLLIGTAAMTASLALHAVATSYVSLLVVRGLAGASGGVLSGAAVSYVGDYFPYDRRGWANGWVMSGIAFGQIAGIPLGTILADLYGYRTPFLVFAIAMGAAFALIWFQVPQPNVQRDEGRLSVIRALRTYADMMRTKEPAAAAAAYFLMFLGFGFFVVYFPTWLTDAVGASGAEIATMFFIGGVASVFTGPQAGSWSDKIGRKPLIIGSCVGLSILMVLTTFVITSMWIATVLFFVTMIINTMRISPLQSLLTAIVPDERRGMLLGMAVGIGQIGIGLAGALAGPIYASAGYLSNTVLAAAGMLAMGAVVWLLLPEPSLVEGDPSG